MSGYFAQELIRAKRDGGTLDAEQLRWIVAGITDGSLSDGQVAAFAMTVFFRDLAAGERAALTGAMRDSGTVLSWDGIDRPVLDKHSTGGVGDKVSLILAPLLAACGAAVPMISGRGLGHTGGTLDKLQAIPGYDVFPAPERLRRIVDTVGCAVIGQTADLAPADRRLYAIRDATGSVESIPLIVASILSKKLAAGLEGLVMDVKWGNGAFMASYEAASELARALVEVATANALPTTALLTDMNQPLGRTAGNGLEVRESIELLLDPASADPRLLRVTLDLARHALALGGLDADPEAVLASGAPAERFGAMVAALGGPTDLVEQPDAHLGAAPIVRAVHPERAGFAVYRDTREVGLAVMELGGGRRREADAIDHAVGLSEVCRAGAAVAPGDGRPLAVLHARDEATFAAARRVLLRAISVEEEPGPSARLGADAAVGEVFT